MKRTTKTVIPFDLKLAQIAWEGKTDSGKEYQLLDRLSRPVRLICTDRKDDNYPVVGLVKANGGYEEINTYTADGHYNHNKDSILSLELWEIKEESQLSNLEKRLAEAGLAYKDGDDLSPEAREYVENLAKDVRYLVKHEIF